MTNLIQTQQHDHVFEIKLNRPEKRNAMNTEMMLGIDEAVLQAEKTPGVRAIIIRGEGTVFSAGIDLMGFEQNVEHFGEGWRENLFPMTHKYQNIFNNVERCSLPVIALLHGYCIGMAFELALACDMRYAAEGTRFGLPEARLGLIPDVGGTTRLTRLVGPGRAKELIMTGKQIDAAHAARWGIVNDVVPADQLAAKGDAIVAELTEAAPLSVSYAKRVIDGLTDVERGLQLEAWAQSVLMRTQDFENGATAMMTKQPVEWVGK